MSKNKNHQKYCNCHSSSDKEILKSNVNYSFCEKCGCILLKSHDGSIYFTLKTKQRRLPYDLSPIEIVKHMKKKTEENYPYIYEEYNMNKNDKHIKEKSIKALNIYLKYRKMLLLKLQKLMKLFDYCDMTFYQTLFFLDIYLRNKMTEDMSEKTILYYLIGFFLCALKFKETDIYEPLLDSFFDLSKGIYLSTEKIAYYEVLCLKTIHYNTFSYSAYDWVSQLISNGVVFNCEVNNSSEIILIKGHRHSLVNTVHKYAVKLLLNLTSRNLFFKYAPMFIAISLIQISREKFIDPNMIKPKLFLKLINLYEIKEDDYKKCYDDILTDLNEIYSESDTHQKEKEKENNNEIYGHLPDLKDHERNESTKKYLKKGKNIYVPNKLKSSNALIRVSGNLINNTRYNENTPNKDKEDSNNEDSKENENKKDDKDIELSLNEVGSKKKKEIKSQKNNIAITNPASHLSIDCNTHIFRSNQNLPYINVNSKKLSIITINNDDTTESSHTKNISYSKEKTRHNLKEITHIRANPNRYHSINSKDTHANSSVATSVEKDYEKDSEKEKDIERHKIKKKSKFFTGSNKNLEIENQLERKNIRTSTKLPIISGFENFNIDRIDTNLGEQNNNNNNQHHHHHHHKGKKHYKLKTHIDNTEVKDNEPGEDIKEMKKTKKLIEVL